MPRKPRKPCSQPGCPALIDIGQRFCEHHRAANINIAQHRDSALKRGYNYQWQKERAAYLARHQLCVRCSEDGIISKATVVDHIIPHRGDESLFWNRNNWQPLCTLCHQRKTAKEDGGFGHGRRGEGGSYPQSRST